VCSARPLSRRINKTKQKKKVFFFFYGLLREMMAAVDSQTGKEKEPCKGRPFLFFLFSISLFFFILLL
jgi:hypothetical protein